MISGYVSFTCRGYWIVINPSRLAKPQGIAFKQLNELVKYMKSI
jgi:hypothetical protein